MCFSCFRFYGVVLTWYIFFSYFLGKIRLVGTGGEKRKISGRLSHSAPHNLMRF